MQYPHGTILNSNSHSTYKKLPENIYFFGVPNILPEPDPGLLCDVSWMFLGQNSDEWNFGSSVVKGSPVL